MKREDLYVYHYADTEFYLTREANSVIDDLEKRIKELELERDNALQLAQEWQETSDNNHRAYVDYYHLCENQTEQINKLEQGKGDLQRLLIHKDNKIKDLEAENERLKAQVPKWVSVNDRLPEDLDKVLVYDEGSIYVAEFNNFHDGKMWVSNWFSSSVEETHWMPLPLPPTTDEAKEGT